MINLRPDEKETGFTLIELLVVILIIGVLAAIAIPMFLNQRETAAQAAMKSDLRNNATMVTAKIDNTGSYPAAAPANLVASDGNTITYASNGKSYCLKAVHPISKSPMYYDSVLDGISENSCSVKLDATGTFYQATPGRQNIYPGLGTWVESGTGPSGEPVMKYTRNEGATNGWGAYGNYNMTAATIPAGTTVKVSYYIRATGNSNYAFQIINDQATSIVSNSNTYLIAGTSWKRVSHTIVTERDWVPNVHYIRWGMGYYTSVEISDVQVEVV